MRLSSKEDLYRRRLLSRSLALGRLLYCWMKDKLAGAYHLLCWMKDKKWTLIIPPFSSKRAKMRDYINPCSLLDGSYAQSAFLDKSANLPAVGLLGQGCRHDEAIARQLL
jgi:hypothetical protein